MRTRWKGTNPIKMTLGGVEHVNLSGWRSVLALLAAEVISQGKSIPTNYLKDTDNGHRTILVHGVYLNVNLCNDDMLTRVRMLSGMISTTCQVVYTLPESTGEEEVTFEGSVVLPTLSKAPDVSPKMFATRIIESVRGRPDGKAILDELFLQVMTG